MIAREHDIMQYSWIVNDLDEAARRWHHATGIGPFIVNRHIVTDNPRYRGTPGGCDLSTAIAQAGSVQVELVEQHDDAPSCYRDTVPAGTEKMHHAAIVVDDYDGVVARYAARGFDVAADGSFAGGRYCYVDTSAAIGHMIEVLETSKPMSAFFAMIAKSAKDWDGNEETVIRVVSDSRKES